MACFSEFLAFTHRFPVLASHFVLSNPAVMVCSGPTENCISCLHYRVPPGMMTPPPLGHPTANTQSYVLDSNMEPVPVGVYGELFLGGAQLSRGYFRRPDLTRERWVKNPFNADANDLLYKTGDLVRWLPDGNIEFLGRTDFQVLCSQFLLTSFLVSHYLRLSSGQDSRVSNRVGRDRNSTLEFCRGVGGHRCLP